MIASAVRADNHVSPHFELTLGVGEAGVPLSPTSIVLPQDAEVLPPLVRRHALGLVGLGFSLATAPPALLEGRPRIGRQLVDLRVFELAQAGRYQALGEEPFDALAMLAGEWLGGREPDWEWDTLRRTTTPGRPRSRQFRGPRRRSWRRPGRRAEKILSTGGDEHSN